MNEKLADKIEEFKSMGIQYTFDGFAVADFLTQLDGLADVKYVEFNRSRLSVLLGDIKGSSREIINLVPAASLLGTISGGVEEVSEGLKLWFEWLLPKEIYYEKSI